MAGRLKPFGLLGEMQQKASNPRELVWLSASAGTGKTQVLSSRVLRLLLQPGVEPSQILCLTFTKAGATEMASDRGHLVAAIRRPSPQRSDDEPEVRPAGDADPV